MGQDKILPHWNASLGYASPPMLLGAAQRSSLAQLLPSPIEPVGHHVTFAFNRD